MNSSAQSHLCLRCRAPVPAELVAESLCVLHFLSNAEKDCAQMRHETATGGLCSERRAEIERYVATSAMKLVSVSTGSQRLSDEMKKRVLTTFLTLMILRENLDRAASQFAPKPRNPQSIEGPSAVPVHSY